MAASRLARGKCSFSPLLYRCGRLWGCPTARVVRHTPPPRLTPVVLYSSSPGIGGKAGRWVKRQVYTVLVLGGLSTGVLVMVCAAWLGNISQYLLQHSAPEQIMTPFLLLSFFCIDHLFSHVPTLPPRSPPPPGVPWYETSSGATLLAGEVLSIQCGRKNSGWYVHSV